MLDITNKDRPVADQFLHAGLAFFTADDERDLRAAGDESLGHMPGDALLVGDAKDKERFASEAQVVSRCGHRRSSSSSSSSSSSNSPLSSYSPCSPSSSSGGT